MDSDPKITELEQHLAGSRKDLRAAVDSVPKRLRERPSHTGGWSVAGIVEHVAIIDRRFVQLLAQFIEQAKAKSAAPDNDPTPLLERFDWKFVLDRSRRVEARENAYPSGLNEQDAWREAERARSDLLGILRSAAGINLATVKHDHPVIGPLDGYQWIVFVGAHEMKHASQIRETASAL